MQAFHDLQAHRVAQRMEQIRQLHGIQRRVMHGAHSGHASFDIYRRSLAARLRSDYMEFNLVMIAALFALAGAGAGDISLDSALGLDLAGTGWALGALGAGLLGGIGAVTLGRQLGRRADAPDVAAQTAS
jgi:hypothetical protein